VHCTKCLASPSSTTSAGRERREPTEERERERGREREREREREGGRERERDMWISKEEGKKTAPFYHESKSACM
jgi:hypothetical protein